MKNFTFLLKTKLENYLYHGNGSAMDRQWIGNESVNGSVDESVNGSVDESVKGSSRALGISTSGQAYIEHILSIYSAYIQHILEPAGKQVAKYGTMRNSCVWKYAACLFLGLILCVGNAWGDNTITETFENQTAESTYNSTRSYTTENSNIGLAWYVEHGCVSSGDPLTGSQSMQMRAYYSASSSASTWNGNLPYLESRTAVQGLTSITFNSKAQTGLKISIQYSTDGSSWSAMKTTDATPVDATNLTLSTSKTSYTYNIPSSNPSSNYYIKISVTSSSTHTDSPSKNGSQEFRLDDIAFTYDDGSSTYSVTYDGNNKTSGTVPTDSNSPYEEDDEVTVLGNSGSLVRTGYTFNGWNTANDGSGTHYDEGDTFTMSTSNVILYAEWKSNAAEKVFNLVENIGDLSIDNKIVIVAINEGNYYAMSSDRGTNRLAVAASASEFSMSNSNKTLTTASTTTLEMLTLTSASSGYFGFQTLNGNYLYAAASSSNYLKTKAYAGDVLDNDSEWKITLSTGVFKVQADKSTNKNDLRFNYNNNNPTIFSCYTEGSNTDVLVYVLEETCSENPTAGTASLNNAFKLTSTTGGVGVKTSGWNVGDECYWEDYGFVWGTTSSPTISDNKVQVGTSGKASNWTGTLTPSGSTSPNSWSAGTTYYVCAYGKNGYDEGEYQYSTAYPFTPQSITYKDGETTLATHYVPKDSVVAEGNIYAPEKTGYTPSWCTDDGLTEDMDWSAAITENMTLYAKWVPIDYVVTLDREVTSSGSESVTVTYNSNTHTDITNPSRNGYTFGGYWTGDNGEGDLVIDTNGTLQENVDGYTGSEGIWIRTTSTTLYAKWTAKTYTVNLNNQGATSAGAESVIATYGQAMPSIAENLPTKLGGRFNGYWTTAEGEGVQYYNADGSSAKNWARYADGEHTLFARWIPSYTITWRVGGQDYTTGSPTTETIEAEGITTMPTPPADNTLNCCNVFKGWSESELGGTGNGAPGDLFTVAGPTINANKTFYAVFATQATTSVTSTFTNSSWENDGDNLWTSGSNGSNFTNDQGVQILGDATAYATTKSSYNKVDSIKVKFCTNKSSGAGGIKISVGGIKVDSIAVSKQGDDGRTLRSHTFKLTTPQTGTVTVHGKGESNSIYIHSVQIYYRTESYSNYMTYCTYEFNDDSGDHQWNTVANWSSRSLPTINDRAKITKPVIVDITTAKAKDIVLDQSSSNTGKLTISAGKALVVAESVKKTSDGETFVATTEEDIFIGSTLGAGTGALVMGNYDGTNEATVQFATKAKKVDGHNVNQFIGTPFNDEDYILYDYYNTKIYEFRAAHDGNKGTENEWLRVASDGGMTAFMGYNILTNQASSPTLEMTGTLNATNANVSKNLYYNGSSNTENMFANSWMAPIHIDAFSKDGSDFGGAEATIYIFNAGTPEDQGNHTDDGAANATAAGQYIVLPVASAPWTSPTVTVIPAMQAFSVYATDADQTLTLDYNKLVYTPALTSVGVVPTRAPRRTRSMEDNPEVIRLRVSAESGYAANACVLGREDFSEGFDNGWDGRFMEGDEEAPQLYIPSADGNMVISCLPDIEGTALVFRKGTIDDVYTFSFEYEGDDVWYLNDTKEQIATQIYGEQNYLFVSDSEDKPARFVISKTPIQKTPTGIDSGGATEVKARKVMIDGLFYIIRAGKMYDVTGALVK